MNFDFINKKWNNCVLNYYMTKPGSLNTSTSLNHFKSWPVIHLVVPIGVSHSFMATRNTIKGVRKKNKEQTNNRGLGQLQCKKWIYVTMHSLCICRLSLACSFCVISTSHEECWLILTGLPSLILDPISCRLVSAAVRCRLPFCVSLRQLPSLWVPLSNSDLRSLAYFRSRRYLELRPLFGLAPKQTKGSCA